MGILCCFGGAPPHPTSVPSSPKSTDTATSKAAFKQSSSKLSSNGQLPDPAQLAEARTTDELGTGRVSLDNFRGSPYKIYSEPGRPLQQKVESTRPQSLELARDIGRDSVQLKQQQQAGQSVVFAKPSDLVKDVQGLRWLGQGAQGVVYEGVWQGATVAVKFTVVDDLDTSAYELLFSKMLCHPNVVQTFNAKVACLDEQTLAPAATQSGSQHGGNNSWGSANNGSSAQEPPAPLQRIGSYHSDDGFGDPYGRKSTFSDVREVLASMGAKPGHYITQMIMEHCDHASLHNAIYRGIFKPTSKWGAKLALRALVRTTREIAQGMYHLHSNQVMHGDLKPANVLLMNSRKDRRGYVAKVSDFGLAQMCTPFKDHVSGAPWGTLVYMAPERLLHGQMFPASDVYAFGVMLWEMYTAMRPFEGMTAAQIVVNAAKGILKLDWPVDSPPELVQLSRECTAALPAERPIFEELMITLTDYEARIRVEGVRLSIDQGGRSSLDSSWLGNGASSAHPGPSRGGANDLSRRRSSSEVPKPAGISRRSSQESMNAPTSSHKHSNSNPTGSHTHSHSHSTRINPHFLQQYQEGAATAAAAAASAAANKARGNVVVLRQHNGQTFAGSPHDNTAAMAANARAALRDKPRAPTSPLQSPLAPPLSSESTDWLAAQVRAAVGSSGSRAPVIPKNSIVRSDTGGSAGSSGSAHQYGQGCNRISEEGAMSPPAVGSVASNKNSNGRPSMG